MSFGSQDDPYAEGIWATSFSVRKHLSNLVSCTFLEFVYHFDGMVAGMGWDGGGTDISALGHLLKMKFTQNILPDALT